MYIAVENSDLTTDGTYIREPYASDSLQFHQSFQCMQASIPNSKSILSKSKLVNPPPKKKEIQKIINDFSSTKGGKERERRTGLSVTPRERMEQRDHARRASGRNDGGGRPRSSGPREDRDVTVASLISKQLSSLLHDDVPSETCRSTRRRRHNV